MTPESNLTQCAGVFPQPLSFGVDSGVEAERGSIPEGVIGLMLQFSVPLSLTSSSPHSGPSRTITALPAEALSFSPWTILLAGRGWGDLLPCYTGLVQLQ